MTLNHGNSTFNCYFFQYTFKKLFCTLIILLNFRGKSQSTYTFFPVNNPFNKIKDLWLLYWRHAVVQ